MTRSRLAPGMLLAMLVASPATGAPAKGAPTAARLLDDAERAITEREGQVARVERNVATQEQSRRGEAVQGRINEGLVFHQLREYARAAIVLIDVVENTANEGHPGFKDALFYLADSLYREKNHVAAERYFRLVLRRGYSQFARDALLRLVEISFITHRYDDVDRYFLQLRQTSGGVLDPKVLYVHARTVYARGKVQEAYDEYMQIPVDSDQGLQSRYLAGVALVALDRQDEAIAHLEDTLRLEPKTDDQKTIVELIHLTIGRLYYERDSFTESVDHYSEIPRGSDYFDESLYEVCWTYVKQKDYERALRSLDVLLLALPDSMFAPEAALVMGNLRLRLARYDEATETFEDLLERFQPIKDKLDAVLRKESDPVLYFNKLIAQQEERFDVTVVLPEEAVKWVNPEQEVDRALVLVGDLNLADQDVEEATGIIERLENALKAGNRVEIFPPLQDAYAELIEAQNALVMVKRLLNDAEKDLVWGVASQADRAAYGEALKAREGAEEDFAVVPKTRDGLENREKQIEERYDKLTKRAFQLSFQIDSIGAQLRAIRKWVADTKNSGTAETSERRIDESMQAQIADIQQLYDDLNTLRRRIELERATIGLGDSVSWEEDAIKGRLATALDREAGVLSRVRQGAGARARDNLTRVDSGRGRITRLEQRIATLFARVVATVDKAVELLASQVRAEKAKVATYRSSVQKYAGVSQALAGRIAYDSFEDVRGMFHDIVLKADVGLVDVAWARKEDTTSTIEGVLEERKNKFRTLDSEYGPIRNPEGEGGAE